MHINDGDNINCLIKSKRFNIVSVFIFALMGCFLAANQSLVQNISLALDATGAEMGYMISALYGGSMAAVLFAGELAERFGKRRAAFVTAVLVTVGSLIILLSQSVLSVIIGFFIYGAGIGGYESVSMSLVSDNNGENSNRYLNFLQALFSAGAVLTPLLLSFLFKADTFRPLYAVAAACYAGFAVFFFTSRWIDDFAVQETRQKGVAFLRLVKNRRMLLYMLAMFIHLGSETALTYWIGSYFGYAGIPAYGAAALSVYWFSSIVGRLLGSRISSPKSIMAPCFLFAAIGSIMLVLLPGPVFKILSVIVVGVAFAPIYAGLALIAGDLFPKNSAPAFSLMIFSAGLGGVLFQPMISLFISSGDPRGAYYIIAALCAAVAVIMAALHKKKA